MSAVVGIDTDLFQGSTRWISRDIFQGMARCRAQCAKIEFPPCSNETRKLTRSHDSIAYGANATNKPEERVWNEDAADSARIGHEKEPEDDAEDCRNHGT